MASQPGNVTFPINQTILDGGLAVSDKEVKKTIIELAENMKIIVEPGGAVALSAAIFKKDLIKNKNVLVIISGGNVDINIFKKQMDIIRKNPDKPFNWAWISLNPNITIDFIINNLDKPFDWGNISTNKFEKDKELFIEEEYRKYLAAYKIQNWWKHITMSPYYAIGRKFIDRDGQELLNEYNEMTK